MEVSSKEVAAIEDAVVEIVEAKARELNDLQLCLIGGGIGEVVFG
jgi:hypothetical protein